MNYIYDEMAETIIAFGKKIRLVLSTEEFNSSDLKNMIDIMNLYNNLIENLLKTSPSILYDNRSNTKTAIERGVKNAIQCLEDSLSNNQK